MFSDMFPEVKVNQVEAKWAISNGKPAQNRLHRCLSTPRKDQGYLTC